MSFYQNDKNQILYGFRRTGFAAFATQFVIPVLSAVFWNLNTDSPPIHSNLLPIAH